ncbi:hypothetical protein [Pseudoneobacillus sp. C159]
MLVEYIIDLTIVALLIIGITAFMGVIPNSIGLKLFGGKTKNEFVEKSASVQSGWKQVGGNKK